MAWKEIAKQFFCALKASPFHCLSRLCTQHEGKMTIYLYISRQIDPYLSVYVHRYFGIGSHYAAQASLKLIT